MLESSRVDYRPTMINLTHVINIVAKELMGTIKSVSRVRETLGDTSAKNPGSSGALPDVISAGAVGGAEGLGAQGAGEGAGAEVKGAAEGDMPVTAHVREIYEGYDAGGLTRGEIEKDLPRCLLELCCSNESTSSATPHRPTRS